jgi:DHA2 family multidrug resistance protein-like MFS transporter
MLQGLGAAGIMSVNSALIRFIYPRRWLGRGVGLNATVGSIASALGPSVASVILSVAPWPYLFAVNVPLGVLGAVIALRTLPLTPLSGGKFDLGSAVLQALAFGMLLFGVSEMGHGDSWLRVGVEMVIAAVSGFVLVVRQLSRTAPLLPIDLLRIPLFALSVTTSICSFIAQAVAQVSMPFLFEHRFQLDQVMTGLLMTPWPLVVAVIAPFTGRLADKYSAGLLGGGGLTVMGLGLLAMALLPDHPSTFDIVWRMTVCGIGFGFFNTPNNRAIILAAPPIRTGGASGMQATARLLGQTTGAALVALVFTAFPLSGPTAALFIAAAVAAAAACVSFSRLAAG